MSRTRIIYGGLAGILAALVIAMIPIMSSCKKELGVDPVPQARDLVGSVRETPSGRSLRSANVNLQLCDGTNIQTTSTDSAGNFVFSGIPIIPAGSCYRVIVQAAGYVPKDTTVNCNCDQLQVGVLYVSVTSCLLTVAPPAVNFGARGPGESVDTLFTVKNPGVVAVTITQLRLTGAPGTTGFTLDATNARVAEDVLPGNADTRSFNVRFSSTQPGVHRDTVLIGKGCDNAPNRVPLEATIATCALSFTPSALNFGILENGYRDSTITVVVRNTSLITAHIDSIWVEGGATFTIDTSGARRSLAPNATMTIRVTAHPLAPTPVPVTGRLVIRTDCNSDQNCPATVTIEAPQCEIPAFSINWESQRGNADTLTIFIINKSIVARLRVDSVIASTTSPSASPNVFEAKVRALGPSYYVKAGDTLKVDVIFRPVDIVQYLGSVQVFSNSQTPCGGTGLGLVATGLRAPSSYPGVLLKWSPFTSTTFLYKGWRFTERKAVADSNNYCNITTSIGDSIPRGEFGINIADFRFGGLLPNGKINISGLRGVKWLANGASGAQLSDPRFKTLTSADFASSNGCLSQFSLYDIIAIRQYESNYYGLIYITAAGYNSEGIQFILFDTIYDIYIPFRNR
jgi:hypothetical protein